MTRKIDLNDYDKVPAQIIRNRPSCRDRDGDYCAFVEENCLETVWDGEGYQVEIPCDIECVIYKKKTSNSSKMSCEVIKWR